MRKQPVKIPEDSRWTLLEFGTGLRSTFVCLCGTVRSVNRDNVGRGKSLSCGCLAKELAQSKKVPQSTSNRPLYPVWKGMWARCTNPKNVRYSDYGGRGIYVVEKWRDFSAFISDMGPKPFPGRECSVERRENDGPYSPDNCKWATRLEQNNNQRRTVWVTLHGRKRALRQWCRELGVNPSTIKSRVFQQGMTYEEAFAKQFQQTLTPGQIGVTPARGGCWPRATKTSGSPGRFPFTGDWAKARAL